MVFYVFFELGPKSVGDVREGGNDSEDGERKCIEDALLRCKLFCFWSCSVCLTSLSSPLLFRFLLPC